MSANQPLRLRARPDLVAQPLGGWSHGFWALKDPVSLKYYQFREEEYFLLRTLDGHMSLAELQAQFERRFAPRKLDPHHLHAFLGTLHREGLLLSDGDGQTDALLERRGKLVRRDGLARLANPLAVRFRGVDPEPLLRRLDPLGRLLFSPVAAFAVGLLLLAALLLVAVQFDTLRTRLPEFHAFFRTENAVWLALAVAGAKVLHELGHGLACRRFGGECHELGLMLLVFTPCLYCNVSDAWLLPDRWRRAAIAAAGIYVELGLAGIATFLWWFSEPGLAQAIFLNTMFVCSVSTLLFNGNPLLRYDGYYILSDLLDLPNLGPVSQSVVRRWLARWFLGLDLGQARLLPEHGQGWLAAYAVAATGYRVFVTGLVLWVVYRAAEPYGLQPLVQVLAVLVVGGMIVGPGWRFVRFLTVRRGGPPVQRWRLAGATLLFSSLLTLALSAPLPCHVLAPVAVQPRDAQRVYVREPGRLLRATAEGTSVAAGTPLAELVNDELDRTLTKLEAERRRLALRREQLQARQFVQTKVDTEIPVVTELLADIEQRLTQRRQERERLTLTAPADGVVLPGRRRPRPGPAAELPGWSGTPLDARNVGSFLERGELFCLLGDPSRLEAVAVIDQSDVEQVRRGDGVTLQFDALPGENLTGTIGAIAELDLDVAPPELVSAGLVVVPDAAGASRLARTAYQARVVLDGPPPRLPLGAAGRARIRVAPVPLGTRLMRFLSRTFRFAT